MESPHPDHRSQFIQILSPIRLSPAHPFVLFFNLLLIIAGTYLQEAREVPYGVRDQ